MSINLDGLIIDRPLYGVFESSDGTVKCGLNQIENFSIDNTADTKDKTDSVGALIKRFYINKAATVSAESAVFSLSLAALQFGSERNLASDSNAITMPRIYIVNVDKVGTTVELPDTPIDGTLVVAPCDSTGAINGETTYESGDEAAEGVYVLSDTTLTLPTDAEGRILIKYDYEATADAVSVTNSADEFPTTGKFTVSLLVCDLCDKEVLRQAYIVFPSFQLDPNVTLSFTTEDTHPFSGVAQKDYCDADGELYTIYLSADDTYDN